MAIINSVDEAFNFVKQKLELAEKKANDTFPAIQKPNEIKNAPITNVYTANAFTFDTYYQKGQKMTSVEQVDKKLEEYSAMLEVNIKTIEEVHQTNIPIIENNRIVKEKITLVMQSIGVPSSYSWSYYKTANSRKMTTETTMAGYITDLARTCITDDGWEMKINSAKSKFEELKRKANDEKQRIQKEASDKAKEEKAKKSIQVLARLQVKYNLDEDSDWTDVLDALDSKNKYFMLARAMEDTRGDWSEGYWRVENAIDNFVVETPEDQEIYDEIHTMAYENEDHDGRIFRDCQWNYSVLYGKVDSELIQDYNTLQEYYSKY